MLNILYTNVCINCLIWIHQMEILNALGDPYGSLLTWNILWFHLLYRKNGNKNAHLKAGLAAPTLKCSFTAWDSSSERWGWKLRQPLTGSICLICKPLQWRWNYLQEGKAVQPALETDTAARIKCPRCLPLAQLPLCWHRHLRNKCLWSLGGNFHPIWCSSTALAVK